MKDPKNEDIISNGESIEIEPMEAVIEERTTASNQNNEKRSDTTRSPAWDYFKLNNESEKWKQFVIFVRRGLNYHHVIISTFSMTL